MVHDFVVHGDGTGVNLLALRCALRVVEEGSYEITWRVGDVALLDNRAMIHAHMPWAEDRPRKILASLVAGT